MAGRIKFTILTMLYTALAFTLLNCSVVNEDSPFGLVDSTGSHPEGWLEGHGSFTLPDGTLCIPCHGDDLDGGITGLTCYTASLDGQSCHTSGSSPHPVDWLDKSSTNFHALAYSPSWNICAVCHNSLQPDELSGYNCLDCHFSEDGTQRTPAGDDFLHTDHGREHWAPPYLACIYCHDINIGFGNQEWCHNCHE